MEVAKKPWAADYEEPDPPENEEQPEEPVEAPPEGSILQDIKTMLSSIPFEMKAFDQELVLHINSAIFSLFAMGTKWNSAPVTGYEQRWTDLFEDMPELHSIKEYIYLRVKLVFDTPGTSYIINSFNARAEQLAWWIKTYSEGRAEDDTGRDHEESERRRADALWSEGDEVVSAHLWEGT